MKLKLALVGCGAMGSALLKGWLPLTSFESFWVISPHRKAVEPFLGDPRVLWFSSPDQLPGMPDVLVFAIKPFLLEEVLPLYHSFNSLILSVAAGKPLSFYEPYFPGRSVVRLMPNIPVCVHQGVIGFLGNKIFSPHEIALLKACFQDLGWCLWVRSDEEVDKLTALSGSGPAYVYYFIEAFAHAAESLGFHPETALILALQTFLGASSYAHNSKESPTILRQHVTSPHGTTAEAIKVLEEGGLPKLMDSAILAAYRRAQELSNASPSSSDNAHRK